MGLAATAADFCSRHAAVGLVGALLDGDTPGHHLGAGAGRHGKGFDHDSAGALGCDERHYVLALQAGLGRASEGPWHRH